MLNYLSKCFEINRKYSKLKVETCKHNQEEFNLMQKKRHKVSLIV